MGRSKLLSYILRHHPEEFDVTVDAAGWTNVEHLLAAISRLRAPMTRSELDEIVRNNDKSRFAFSEDGTRIRAVQGHSLDVDFEYPPAMPPELLFHGTPEANVASIREQGLDRGSRHHVHLSGHPATAKQVGARRGRAVVLTIRSKQMAGAGHDFFRSPNGVWLTSHVPPTFIDFPD